MTQSDRSARTPSARGPKRRTDSNGPASTRRGGDRRPYPTAPTTTRVSPAKPGSTTTRPRSRGSAPAPTPATVWTAGPVPIDLHATWPTPIVSKIVNSFSKPGARVALLPWPTTDPAPGKRHGLDAVGADGVIKHAPGTDQDDVTEALAVIESLDRSSRVVHVAAEDDLTGRGARPFWADLVAAPDPVPVTVSPTSPSAVRGRVLDGPDAVSPDTDLIITSLRPEHSHDHTSDLVAQVAARLLRVGGILAVLTHSDLSTGEFIDPTGALVAAAQNADLLYLQHIVALHTPVRDGRFAVERLAELHDAADDDHARARHRAAVRGLPAPHQRIHSDVLVFAQPHEHGPHPASAARSNPDTGATR
ncbi:hypothetical protein [Kibdelosporangium persicum]|nr:hypothetical protein [Kibdelosporangium persicum]